IMKYYGDNPPETGDVEALWKRVAALGELGNLFLAQDDLESYRDSLAIREQLAKRDPNNADWQRDFSVGYEKVGDVLRAQGDLAGALKSYQDDLAIAEKLAKQNPNNADWQRGLSVGYEKVGDVLSAQGDLADALKYYRDSAAAAEKLEKLYF